MVAALDIVLFITYFILVFLAMFWMIVLFTRDNTKKEKLGYDPLFSVIVPAYNEEASVEGTLQSLVDLEYPKDKIEIVVVNDGSKDNTQSIVEKFIASHPLDNIKLINQENQGKGRAMNNALAIIKGEFFACLDADSFIKSDALKFMLPYFCEEQVAAVCPLLKVKKPENILQKVQWYEYIINMFYKDLNARLDCIHVTPGPFSVFRTKVIQDLGGYNEETITEDLEIAIRLQKHNYKLKQDFDAIVETVAPKTWKTLFRQRTRWYKGSVDNTVAYKDMIFNKKYGDFGYVRMPTIILSGIIAVVLVGFLGHSFGQQLYYSFLSLKAINFDIITLIKNYSFGFNFLNLPFFKLFIAGTLISISIFVMFYSYKLVKEKLTRYGRTWLSLITYLLIYSLFLTTVWAYIGYMFVRKKKNTW
ncbi:MAG: glycosyltransferase family 2 protein [Nanoarchaeota archaeon]|nr:glycosyltransferase family 2 protein [Nanoarchaeota archaeon]